MKKGVERLGYDAAFNPPGDGDFFYASVAKALGIETQGLKKVIFNFLKSHQSDVNIQLIANSRTTKIRFFESIGSDVYWNFRPNAHLAVSTLQLANFERVAVNY